MILVVARRVHSGNAPRIAGLILYANAFYSETLLNPLGQRIEKNENVDKTRPFNLLSSCMFFRNICIITTIIFTSAMIVKISFTILRSQPWIINLQ